MTSPRGLACARLMVLGLVFALLTTLASPGLTAAEAGDGWWGGLDEGEAVSLANILRAPRDYRGRTLTFFCLFHRKEKYFDPMRTQFSPQRYDNLSAWPDGAPVWEQRAYEEGDLPFLYIRRNHAQRDALMNLEPFTRIEVTGRVRDLLRGRPTIEIFSFRVTGHRVGKRVIRNVVGARNTARMGTKNGYQLAAQSLKRALIPDLAPLYAIAVRKMLADALRKLGHHAEADAYDRGETYGTSDLPEPDAPRHPRAAPGGDLPGAPAFDRPTLDRPGVGAAGRVAGVGSPDGSPDGPSSRALSGSPDGDDAPHLARRADVGSPPTGPRTGRRAARPAGGHAGGQGTAPGRTPLTRPSDLPGAPRGSITADSDLPGARAAPARAAPDGGAAAGSVPGGGAFPPPAAARLPGSAQGATRQPTEAAKPAVRSLEPVRRGPVSGIPPTRTPRLSGVR